MNYGGFSLVVAPFCHRVVGYEPNIYWNNKRPALPANVTIVNKAVAAKAGILTFYAAKNGGASSTLHRAFADPDSSVYTVEAITLSDVFATEPSGRVGLLKIDIEGEEVELLQSAPDELLLRVAQISVEFEEFHDEVAICTVIRRMKGLGFWVVKFSWRNYGDVLFVNQKLEKLSATEKMILAVYYKYCRGLFRMGRRTIVMRRLSAGLENLRSWTHKAPPVGSG